MANIIEFSQTALSTVPKDKLTVLYFSAPWCGPCASLWPVVSEAIQSIDLNLFKVNADEHSEFCGSYGIRAVPTMVLMKNDQIILKKSGANTPLKELKELFENAAK